MYSAGKAERPRWMKWCVALVCVCIVAAGVFAAAKRGNNGENPDPDRVQVVNPLMQVGSVEEMERYLDFSVPVLEKEIESCIVLVFDNYPQIGRICYADGAVFNIKYGSGDISGIYGGILEKTEEIGGVSVSFYIYADEHYAIWEKAGFTHSLTGEENLSTEVSALMN